MPSLQMHDMVFLLAVTQQARNTAAGMINNQYWKHRDDTETSTENKAVIKIKSVLSPL